VWCPGKQERVPAPGKIRVSRALFRELLNAHTILLSTQILSEVEMTFDRFMIIHRGRVVASNSLAELARNAGAETVVVVEAEGALATETIRQLPGVRRLESEAIPNGTRLRITRIAGGPWDSLLTPVERDAYFRRSIVVTVMDRGAFTHALDLSWGAFAELGNPAEGVIRVLIEPVDGNGFRITGSVGLSVGMNAEGATVAEAMPLARSFDSAQSPRSIGATSDTGAMVDGSAAEASTLRRPRFSRSSGGRIFSMVIAS